MAGSVSKVGPLQVMVLLVSGFVAADGGSMALPAQK